MLVDELNNTIATGSAGSANLATTSEVQILQNLQLATENMPKADFAVGCFAGMLTHSDRLRAMNLLSQANIAEQIEVEPDYAAALAADPLCHTILISGTGCIVASRINGQLVKTAGGGPLLGDTGSVFDLGRIAINETFLNTTQKPASPIFLQSLSDIFGSNDRDQILATIYKSSAPAAKVAKLAPSIALDYHTAKPYARTAVNQCIDSILNHLQNHYLNASNFPSPWQVRLTGGLWNIDPIFFELIKTKASSYEFSQNCNIQVLNEEPIQGAIKLAQTLA